MDVATSSVSLAVGITSESDPRRTFSEAVDNNHLATPLDAICKECMITPQ